MVQNEIHPYYQEREDVEYIQSLGIVVQAWYPLGGRGYTADLLGNEVISKIAQVHEKSSAQIILRWDLQNDELLFRVQAILITSWRTRSCMILN